MNLTKPVPSSDTEWHHGEDAAIKTVYTEGESFETGDGRGSDLFQRFEQSGLRVYLSPAGALTAGGARSPSPMREGGVRKTGGVRYYGERARARPCQHRDHGTANKDGIHGGEAFDPAGLGVTAKYSEGGADKVLPPESIRWPRTWGRRGRNPSPSPMRKAEYGRRRRSILR